ncbi:MAG: DUF4296 domain-containing protein [Bacteroidota bacterium]|nr:DUF4296 domain-containing protein [Bacteroidota bacterium]
MKRLQNRKNTKMRKPISRILWIMLLLASIIACSKTPKGVISEKKMENILYDCYVGSSMTENQSIDPRLDPSQVKRQYLFSVLKKYDVSKAEYDSSLNWYAQNLKVYLKVYDHVIARLKKEQKKIQLEKGEPAQQQGNIASGDTVDIWTRSNLALLNELPAFSHSFAEIRANESFQLNDQYKFTANVRNLRSSGNFSPKMVLTVCYTNDSTQTVSRNINNSSRVELQLKTSSSRKVDKVIAGFTQNGSGLVMIENISLLRIHEKKKP